MSLQESVEYLETTLNKQDYHKAWFNGLVCEHDYRDAFVLKFLTDQNYQPVIIDVNEYTHIGSSDIDWETFIDNKIGEALQDCSKHDRPMIVFENFQHIQNAGQQSYITTLMEIDGLFKARTLNNEADQFIPVFFSSCYYYDYSISGRFPSQVTWYITNANIRDSKHLESIHEQIYQDNQINYARIRSEEDQMFDDELDEIFNINHETNPYMNPDTNTNSNTNINTDEYSDDSQEDKKNREKKKPSYLNNCPF